MYRARTHELSPSPGRSFWRPLPTLFDIGSPASARLGCFLPETPAFGARCVSLVSFTRQQLAQRICVQSVLLCTFAAIIHAGANCGRVVLDLRGGAVVGRGGCRRPHRQCVASSHEWCAASQLYARRAVGASGSVPATVSLGGRHSARPAVPVLDVGAFCGGLCCRAGLRFVQWLGMSRVPCTFSCVPHYLHVDIFVGRHRGLPTSTTSGRSWRIRTASYLYPRTCPTTFSSIWRGTLPTAQIRLFTCLQPL